jgi:hypothetical protein
MYHHIQLRGLLTGYSGQNIPEVPVHFHCPLCPAPWIGPHSALALPTVPGVDTPALFHGELLPELGGMSVGI